jgi:hypothetical protein
VGKRWAAGSLPFSRPGRFLKMGLFYNIMIGYFFGFALGVGCALAVFYAIYTGGYRKAVEDSLQPQKSNRYLEETAAAQRRLKKHVVTKN